MVRLFAMIFALALAGAYAVMAQTTDGIILGRITNDVTGESIGGVKVVAVHRETGLRFEATSTSTGYALVRLSPGLYDLSVELDPYRPSRIERIELPVAGTVRQNISLRLITDLWQQNLLRSVVARDQRTVLLFYGPDVDVSRSLAVEDAGSVSAGQEPTISALVAPKIIDRLPLAGRDAYQLIALMPGAASGLATVRGAAVSVNGQRPSASNFLLDGVENNNYLITGPFSPLPPEAVEQYRISTNNFSAEYGRTSGYIANSVTYTGQRAWHALAYAYGNHEALNGFQDRPLREREAGGRVTGPLDKAGLFHSEVFDFMDSRTVDDARPYRLPGPGLLAQVTAKPSLDFLATSTPPAGGVANADGTRSVRLNRPRRIERLSALQRIDWQPSGTNHVMARWAISRQSVPNFIWSPYPGFSSPLDQNNFAVALAYTRKASENLSFEVRGSVNRDSLAWDRARNNIPKIGFPPDFLLTLPGSPAKFVLNTRGLASEAHGNVLSMHGRNVVKAGGGFISRNINGLISVLNAVPELNFADWSAFAQGLPDTVRLPGSRNAILAQRYEAPDMNRHYRYTQTFGFVQETFRLNSRVVLHAGLRYDYFGVPHNAGGTKDWLLDLGSGATLAEQLQGATLARPKTGSQPLYAADHNNWAPRLGFSANLARSGDLVLRGAYGLFYDRPFDNLWLNLRFNDALPVVAKVPGPIPTYTVESVSRVAPGTTLSPSWQDFGVTLYQPGIRTPYIQSFFFGLQRKTTSSSVAELNYVGSRGRKLITTDRINRLQSDFSRPNPDLHTDIDYRFNGGQSSYHSLMASLRWRGKRTDAQVNYTWAHAIDNQSDPLQGLLGSNLELANLGGGTLSPKLATFTTEYSGSADRANADFDQRHSLTAIALWSVPAPHWSSRAAAPLRNWTAAAVGAMRAGTPYTIYGASRAPLRYNHPNLVARELEFAGAGPVSGGRRLLNSKAFEDAIPASRPGNVGRNAFRGPAFYGLDLSLARHFDIPVRDHAAVLELRADAYNVLNHANLSNPNFFDGSAFLGSPNFAVARYGRSVESGGPLSVLPLSETNRRVQLMLRIGF